MDKKTHTGISPVKLKSASELRMAVTDEASAARERIRALFDEGTFSETGAFAHRIASELGGDVSLRVSSPASARSTADSFSLSFRIRRD